MSTTSASCCCDPVSGGLYGGYYVKGSGNEKLSSDDTFGFNGNSLNLNLAEVDKCIPCTAGIHGAIRIWIGRGRFNEPIGKPQRIFIEGYGNVFGQDANAYPQIYPVLVNYGQENDSLEEKGLLISKFPSLESMGWTESGAWFTPVPTTIILEPAGLPPLPTPELPNIKDGSFDNHYKTLINLIKQKPLELDEDGNPFKICDCFTDNLYTSPDKTEKENNRARRLQLLCEQYNVGINSAHIEWKPSKYIGKHDTTIISPLKTLEPGELALAKCINTNGKDGCCELPQQTKHATSIILPKKLENQRIEPPIMMNLPYIVGKYNEDPFFKVRPTPADYSYNSACTNFYEPRTPHNTDRMKAPIIANLRAFLQVMYLAPDGFNGYPFQGIKGFESAVIVPGMFDNGWIFMWPQEAKSGEYNEAISQLLTPDAKTWERCKKVLKEPSITGTAVGAAPGCPDCITDPCLGGGRGSQPCEGSGTLVRDPGEIITLPALPGTFVPAQKANIYYSGASDSELSKISKRSLMYFTLNGETKFASCPLDGGSSNDYTITSCGGTFIFGRCCFGGGSVATPRSNGEPVCPNRSGTSFLTKYTMGEIIYDIQKIKTNDPFIRFYINPTGRGLYFGDPAYKTSSKVYNIQSKILEQKSGCGKWLGPATHAILNDNAIYNWWNMDDAELLMPEKDTTTTLNLIEPRPLLWQGTQAVLEPGLQNSEGTCTCCDKTCQARKGCVGRACIEAEIVSGQGCGEEPTSSITYRYGTPTCTGCVQKEGRSETGDCGSDGGTWKTEVSYSYTITTYCGAAQFFHNQYCLRNPDLCVPFCESGDGACCCCTDDGDDDCESDAPPEGFFCNQKPDKWKNNPGVIHTEDGYTNYGAMLSGIGSMYAIKTFNKKGYKQTSPYNGIVLSITTRQYKQTLITSLYGKDLEFGSIDLQTFAADETTFRKNLSSPRGGVGEAEIITSTIGIGTDPFSLYWRQNWGRGVFGTTKYLRKRSWPQGVMVDPIKKKPASAQPLPNEQEFIQNVKEILKNRVSKYPTQSIRGGDDDGCDFGEVTTYWKERAIYELADIFAIKSDPTVKTDYYPAGIPDLSSTSVKLVVKGNGIVTISSGYEEYDLNWFFTSYKNMLDLTPLV